MPPRDINDFNPVVQNAITSRSAKFIIYKNNQNQIIRIDGAAEDLKELDEYIIEAKRSAGNESHLTGLNSWRNR